MATNTTGSIKPAATFALPQLRVALEEGGVVKVLNVSIKCERASLGTVERSVFAVDVDLYFGNTRVLSHFISFYWSSES